MPPPLFTNVQNECCTKLKVSNSRHITLQLAAAQADPVGFIGDLPEHIAAGGYPAALARLTPRRKSAWYRDYIETMVQRDVHDLARIRSLDILPRLLMLAAGVLLYDGEATMPDGFPIKTSEMTDF